MKEKIRIYFCIKLPLIESDLEKLGIKYFLKDFDVKILDFTNLLQSQSIEFFKPIKTFPFLNIIDIKKFSEVDKIFDKPGFVIDYIGQFSLKSILVFNIVKKKNFKNFLKKKSTFTLGNKK